MLPEDAPEKGGHHQARQGAVVHSDHFCLVLSSFLIVILIVIHSLANASSYSDSVPFKTEIPAMGKNARRDLNLPFITCP